MYSFVPKIIKVIPIISLEKVFAKSSCFPKPYYNHFSCFFNIYFSLWFHRLQYWIWKGYCEQKKKKKDAYFLSVENQSTIDKKWKKSRITWLLCFSFLCEGFVFYCNIIWAVFYLVENANMNCADKQMTEISDIGYPSFWFYTMRTFTIII